MPYNNTPITPSKEVTGTVSLPLARVKKIIAADDDIANCSNNAAFMITVAAEMFLQHLVEQSYNIVKSERKPRRNIQYRDVAHAVSRVESLEFLTDVVPKTTTFKQVKQKARAQPAASAAGNSGETPIDPTEQADRVAAQNGLLALSGQTRIDEPMGGRASVPDVQIQPGPPPPTSRLGLLVAQQATNGASERVKGDAMDVDEDFKRPVSSHMLPPERDTKMEGA